MKSHGLHAVPLFLCKQFHLIALHHAVEAAVRAQKFDGRRRDVGSGGEILDGDELSVLDRKSVV